VATALRHVLALVSKLARRDAVAAARALCAPLEQLLTAAAAAAAAAADKAVGLQLVFHDRFARMHLLHICAAVMHAPAMQHVRPSPACSCCPCPRPLPPWLDGAWARFTSAYSTRQAWATTPYACVRTWAASAVVGSALITQCDVSTE
jgi:hypothetical protein